ncbi:MAG: hypothetical protein CMK59_14510 [Proteobacteria bacterium]|nr:hypothetical protein [Pseudomonadota bacterium]
MDDQWVELRWCVSRSHIAVCTDYLFELGASGVQEDYLPGEAPPPRQPWDKGPLPPLPEYKVLRSWWLQPEADRIRNMWDKEQRFLEQEQPQWLPCDPSQWGSDWKSHFKRHCLSDRLAVAPPWEALEGDLVIEPGVAFGTGEHPTTLSCLEAIAQWSEDEVWLSSIGNKRCLDVGCGSGILAMAAAKVGFVSEGIDIDSDAIEAANKNAEQNELSISFSTMSIHQIEGTYPLIVANLYAEVLEELSGELLRLVAGRLALAGILLEKEALVTQAFKELNLIRRRVDGDWVSLWYSSKE